MGTMLFNMKQKTGSIKDVLKSNEDLIKKIESCRNFSSAYTIYNNPEQDILSETIPSVVFKCSENLAKQTVTFEYWVKESNEAKFYSITISTQDKLVDVINDANGYTIPASALKFNDRNELELIYYGSPRR